VIRSGDRSLDAATLDARARRAAAGLTELGVGADDCIALLVRNDFVFFECTAAAAFVGAYVVPLNWHFRGEELAHVLLDCGARAVVVHADLLPLLGGIVPDGVSIIVVATPPGD